jgi:hypothetical protein
MFPDGDELRRSDGVGSGGIWNTSGVTDGRYLTIRAHRSLLGVSPCSILDLFLQLAAVVEPVFAKRPF